MRHITNNLQILINIMTVLSTTKQISKVYLVEETGSERRTTYNVQQACYTYKFDWFDLDDG